MTVRPEAGEIYLDTLNEGDAATLHLWRQDPDVSEGSLAYPFATGIEAEREWIRSFAPQGTPRDLCLAVRARGSDALLGYCQLRAIDWIARTAEFGIVIGPAQSRGRGLGKRALALTRDYAVGRLGLRRLWLRVVAFNSAAIALYESNGFVLEGRMPRHAHSRGGLHDVLIYGWEAPARPAADAD
ncbi:GNAT family N-acetyltransferase [Pseudomonas sp. CGJS7]|uniref:GNAT family N-acetyltransferase n=1 Tax=Pseudomonas sp. CGJS7 TaxID=3109348 RepID=UPI00300AC5D1